MKKLYEETNIQNIANAIREKNGSTDTYKTSDMAQAISEITTEPNVEALTVTRLGTYNAPSGVDGYNPILCNMPIRQMKSPYVDDNGKFVKPEEWDDIESIELNDNDDVVYYLYDNTSAFSKCYLSLRPNVNTGKIQVDYGRITNGIFNIIKTEQYTSYSYITKLFDDDEQLANENYIVVRIKPITGGAYFTSIGLGSNITVDSSVVGYNYQTMLMRYGNVKNATTISGVSYYIVSDNIKNCVKLTTLGSLYASCYFLVRHRHYGWNTTNVTRADSMFSNCASLTDCDTDFSNWFSGGKLTNICFMFNNCYSLRGDINVTNWITNNVTGLGSIFYYCCNITRIIGIEQWYIPKYYTTGYLYLFSYCYSLYQNDEGILDLSNWHLGELASSTHKPSFYNLFASCVMLKTINISTWATDNITNLYNAFGNCWRLEELYLNNDFASSGYLTSCSSTFNYCINLKEINIPNINLTNVNNFYNFTYLCFTLKNVILGNSVPVGSTSNSTFFNFTNNYYLESLDMSNIDCSKFTYSSSLYNNIFVNCTKLKNFYPPQHIQKNFSLSSCYNLSRESALRVLENLDTVTVKTTLTLTASTKSRLTAEEIAIATDKGWTVA